MDIKDIPDLVVDIHPSGSSITKVPRGGGSGYLFDKFEPRPDWVSLLDYNAPPDKRVEVEPGLFMVEKRSPTIFCPVDGNPERLQMRTGIRQEFFEANGLRSRRRGSRPDRTELLSETIYRPARPEDPPELLAKGVSICSHETFEFTKWVPES